MAMALPSCGFSEDGKTRNCRPWNSVLFLCKANITASLSYKHKINIFMIYSACYKFRQQEILLVPSENSVKKVKWKRKYMHHHSEAGDFSIQSPCSHGATLLWPIICHCRNSLILCKIILGTDLLEYLLSNTCVLRLCPIKLCSPIWLYTPFMHLCVLSLWAIAHNLP